MSKDATRFPIGALLLDIRLLLNQARRTVTQAINSAMVQTYWQIGRAIVEHEQRGNARAEYGKQQLAYLSAALGQEFGKGFDVTNLRNMRRFYHVFPIRETVSLELAWSHYCKIIRIYDQTRKEPEDNPTIGLILCSEKSEAVVKYSVLTDSAQLFASRYKPYLPTEEELRRELERGRAQIEAQQAKNTKLSPPARELPGDES